MIIEEVYIYNYKTFKEINLKLNEDINILVGNNEVGKSTILEAINLALTGQLNGKNVSYELTPFLFNECNTKKYIEELQNGNFPCPPKILIELYLKDSDSLAEFLGTNNSKRENKSGFYILIEFDETYSVEYTKYISNPSEIRTIPIEYYSVRWYSFANNPITSRSIPLNTTLIDASFGKQQFGTDKYISKIINDYLNVKERVDLSLSFRKLKELFSTDENIQNINTKLQETKGEITDKTLTLSVDISPKTNWESNLTSYLDDIPFQFIGKGEQNSIKIKLALEASLLESNLILIEEPENHLSYSNMSILIDKISEKCEGKQLIITTHSTFVLNKLGIDKVILLNNNSRFMSLKDLSSETQKYFKILPGFDTLRMLLSQKPILVEGPSDELIVQKAYKIEKNKLPINDGIDIITVRGLSFKRFLEIANILQKDIKVITDNDGNIANLNSKYADYRDVTFIKIFYDTDESYPTLEPQIVKCNNLETLNTILGRSETTKEDMIEYMKKNKTETALKIFESDTNIEIPEYIKNAIQ